MCAISEATVFYRVHVKEPVFTIITNYCKRIIYSSTKYPYPFLVFRDLPQHLVNSNLHLSPLQKGNKKEGTELPDTEVFPYYSMKVEQILARVIEIQKETWG